MSGDMMETPVQTLKRAWELDQRGGKLQAETLYRQVLRVEPENGVALFLLGRLELELGRAQPAAEHLSAAVRRDASQAVYHATLARAYAALDRHREAVACYRAALELEPDAADYYTNLARSLLFSKEAGQAIACYEKAIACDPTQPEAHSGLGAVLEHRGRFEEAVEHYRQAIHLRPTYAQAHYNLGTALLKRGQAAEAVQSLHAAAQLLPAWDAALANLAAAYHALGRSDEAREHLDAAIKEAPHEPDHHASLGTLLRHQGRFAEAIESYDRALALRPDHVSARVGRSAALLSVGRFAEGWADYDCRIGCPPYNTAQLPQPLWDGTPLAGRQLLIHCEQGLSDTLQFIRYVPLVRRREASVALAVHPSLVPLLTQSGYAPLVPLEEPLPACDVQIPLMSLPRVFDTRVDTVPADVPYLSADPSRVERWRDWLRQYPSIKIGIAWQGRPNFPGDETRSIPLVSFAPVAQINGVRLVSLQKGPGTEQVSALEDRFEVVDPGPDFDREGGFLDTAALMQSLDLVISSDTSVAHLAGALGVRVWVALAQVANWRWLLDRDDSPWYPTMRLYRQEVSGDWAQVFERMAKDLAELAGGKPMPA